ncbi:MAG: leucine-rich repeat domain-containing protein, partial [Muribaculaceae bacterium]|nr:leucine-rich repeat domain-containing protein [Muribaculaceae bacterium]
MKKKILFWCLSLLSSTLCYAEKVGDTPSMLVMQGGIGMQMDVENVEQGVPFNVFVDWIGNISYNTGKDFFGSIALALIDKDNEIKEILHEEQDIHLSPGWGYGQLHRFCPVTVESEIADTDIIRFITKENSLTRWQPVESRECEITFCPVRGNVVHTAEVNVTILGNNDIPLECYCEATYYQEPRQEQAVYSSGYCIEIHWPEGKDHHFVKVDSSLDRIQIDPDRILIQIVDQPRYDITLMACSDDELVTEQLHYMVYSSVTLEEQLKKRDDLLYINNLSISGMVDDADIEFMRYEMPMLEHIDLSKAQIKGGLLPDYAFDRKGLKSLLLPKDIWGLGYNSLSGTKLYELDIPASVEYFGLNALNGSKDLTLLVLRNPEVIPVSW